MTLSTFKTTGLAKTISLLALLSFLFPSVTWAFQSGVYARSNPGVVELLHLGKPIRVPENLAMVESAYQGKGKTVVCIQDLHCNAEVQGNIAGLLGHLAEQNGLQLVCEEGASGPVDLSILRSFPLAKIRNQVSRYFLEQGKLSGAEHYAATDGALRLEGLEVPALYQESLQAVRAFVNDENQGAILDLREVLQDRKAESYSADLRRHDQVSRGYRQGRVLLVDYAAHLNRQARRLGVDLAPFGHLNAYLSLVPVGRRMDISALVQEAETLDWAVRDRLFIQTHERELAAVEDKLDRLEKLLNVSATPDEVAEIRLHRDAYRIQALAERLDTGADAPLLAGEMQVLDNIVDLALRFYELADARSRQFADAMLARMDATGTDLAVMINGGFHNPKVLEELKRRNVSCLSVKPCLTRLDLVNPYFSLLKGKPLPIEKLLEKNQTVVAIPSWPQSEPASFARTAELDVKALALADGSESSWTPALREYFERHHWTDLRREPARPGYTLISVRVADTGKNLFLLVADTRRLSERAAQVRRHGGTLELIHGRGIAAFERAEDRQAFMQKYPAAPGWLERVRGAVQRFGSSVQALATSPKVTRLGHAVLFALAAVLAGKRSLTSLAAVDPLWVAAMVLTAGLLLAVPGTRRAGWSAIRAELPHAGVFGRSKKLISSPIRMDGNSQGKGDKAGENNAVPTRLSASGIGQNHGREDQERLNKGGIDSLPSIPLSELTIPDQRDNWGAHKDLYIIEYQGRRCALLMSNNFRSTDPEEPWHDLLLIEEITHTLKFRSAVYPGHPLAPEIFAKVTNHQGKLVGYIEELIQGENFGDLIFDWDLEPEAILDILKQLQEQITYMHEKLGLVHGDAKIRNVIVNNVGGRYVARWIDFGRFHLPWKQQLDQDRFNQYTRDICRRIFNYRTRERHAIERIKKLFKIIDAGRVMPGHETQQDYQAFIERWETRTRKEWQEARRKIGWNLEILNLEKYIYTRDMELLRFIYQQRQEVCPGETIEKTCLNLAQKELDEIATRGVWEDKTDLIEKPSSESKGEATDLYQEIDLRMLVENYNGNSSASDYLDQKRKLEQIWRNLELSQNKAPGAIGRLAERFGWTASQAGRYEGWAAAFIYLATVLSFIFANGPPATGLDLTLLLLAPAAGLLAAFFLAHLLFGVLIQVRGKDISTHRLALAPEERINLAARAGFAAWWTSLAVPAVVAFTIASGWLSAPVLVIMVVLGALLASGAVHESYNRLQKSVLGQGVAFLQGWEWANAEHLRELSSQLTARMADPRAWTPLILMLAGLDVLSRLVLGQSFLAPESNAGLGIFTGAMLITQPTHFDMVREPTGLSGKQKNGKADPEQMPELTGPEAKPVPLVPEVYKNKELTVHPSSKLAGDTHFFIRVRPEITQNEVVLQVQYSLNIGDGKKTFTSSYRYNRKELGESNHGSEMTNHQLRVAALRRFDRQDCPELLSRHKNELVVDMTREVVHREEDLPLIYKPNGEGENGILDTEQMIYEELYPLFNFPAPQVIHKNGLRLYSKLQGLTLQFFGDPVPSIVSVIGAMFKLKNSQRENMYNFGRMVALQSWLSNRDVILDNLFIVQPSGEATIIDPETSLATDEGEEVGNLIETYFSIVKMILHWGKLRPNEDVRAALQEFRDGFIKGCKEIHANKPQMKRFIEHELHQKRPGSVVVRMIVRNTYDYSAEESNRVVVALHQQGDPELTTVVPHYAVEIPTTEVTRSLERKLEIIADIAEGKLMFGMPASIPSFDDSHFHAASQKFCNKYAITQSEQGIEVVQKSDSKLADTIQAKVRAISQFGPLYINAANQIILGDERVASFYVLPIMTILFREEIVKMRPAGQRLLSITLASGKKLFYDMVSGNRYAEYDPNAYDNRTGERLGTIPENGGGINKIPGAIGRLAERFGWTAPQAGRYEGWAAAFIYLAAVVSFIFANGPPSTGLDLTLLLLAPAAGLLAAFFLAHLLFGVLIQVRGKDISTHRLALTPQARINLAARAGFAAWWTSLVVPALVALAIASGWLSAPVLAGMAIATAAVMGGEVHANYNRLNTIGSGHQSLFRAPRTGRLDLIEKGPDTQPTSENLQEQKNQQMMKLLHPWSGSRPGKVIHFAGIKDEAELENLGLEKVRDGQYFDIDAMSDGSYVVVLKYRQEMTKTSSNIWRDIFWHARKEIDEFFNRQLTWNVNVVRVVQAAECLALGMDHSERMAFMCGQMVPAFRERIERFRAGEIYRHDQNEVESDTHSHIEWFSWLYYKEFEAIKKMARVARKSTPLIVDIGAGFGPFGFYVQDYVSPDARVLWTDIQKDVLQSAKDYAERAKIPNMEFEFNEADEHPPMLASAEKLRNAWERHFHSPPDFIVLNHVVEHLEQARTNEGIEALMNTWLAVAQLGVMFSIPYEKGEDLSDVNPHQTQFTPERLLALAKDYQNRRTDVLVDISNVNAGLLIFSKNHPGDGPVSDRKAKPGMPEIFRPNATTLVREMVQDTNTSGPWSLSSEELIWRAGLKKGASLDEIRNNLLALRLIREMRQDELGQIPDPDHPAEARPELEGYAYLRQNAHNYVSAIRRVLAILFESGPASEWTLQRVQGEEAYLPKTYQPVGDLHIQGELNELHSVRKEGSTRDTVLKLADFGGPFGPSVLAGLIRELSWLRDLQGVGGVARLEAAGYIEQSQPTQRPEQALGIIDLRPDVQYQIKAFVELERVDGESLDELLERGMKNVSNMEVVALTRGLLRILGEMHRRGVIHNDIQPKNILIPYRESPEGKHLDFVHPCLIDFEMSTRIGEEGRIQLPTFVGWKAFAAPESIDDCIYSPQTDLFALGKVLRLIPEKNTALADSRWIRILDKLTHQELTGRYNSAEGVLKDLEDLETAGNRQDQGGLMPVTRWIVTEVIDRLFNANLFGKGSVWDWLVAGVGRFNGSRHARLVSGLAPPTTVESKHQWAQFIYDKLIAFYLENKLVVLAAAWLAAQLSNGAGVHLTISEDTLAVLLFPLFHLLPTFRKGKLSQGYKTNLVWSILIAASWWILGVSPLSVEGMAIHLAANGWSPGFKIGWNAIRQSTRWSIWLAGIYRAVNLIALIFNAWYFGILRLKNLPVSQLQMGIVEVLVFSLIASLSMLVPLIIFIHVHELLHLIAGKMLGYRVVGISIPLGNVLRKIWPTIFIERTSRTLPAYVILLKEEITYLGQLFILWFPTFVLSAIGIYLFSMIFIMPFLFIPMVAMFILKNIANILLGKDFDLNAALGAIDIFEEMRQGESAWKSLVKSRQVIKADRYLIKGKRGVEAKRIELPLKFYNKFTRQAVSSGLMGFMESRPRLNWALAYVTNVLTYIMFSTEESPRLTQKQEKEFYRLFKELMNIPDERMQAELIKFWAAFAAGEIDEAYIGSRKRMLVELLDGLQARGGLNNPVGRSFIRVFRAKIGERKRKHHAVAPFSENAGLLLGLSGSLEEISSPEGKPYTGPFLNFAQEILAAMQAAPSIRFNLTGMDLSEVDALSSLVDDEGNPFLGDTNYELWQIFTNPELLKKTTFYRDGIQVETPVLDQLKLTADEEYLADIHAWLLQHRDQLEQRFKASTGQLTKRRAFEQLQREGAESKSTPAQPNAIFPKLLRWVAVTLLTFVFLGALSASSPNPEKLQDMKNGIVTSSTRVVEEDAPERLKDFLGGHDYSLWMAGSYHGIQAEEHTKVLLQEAGKIHPDLRDLLQKICDLQTEKDETEIDRRLLPLVNSYNTFLEPYGMIAIVRHNQGSSRRFGIAVFEKKYTRSMALRVAGKEIFQKTVLFLEPLANIGPMSSYGLYSNESYLAIVNLHEGRESAAEILRQGLGPVAADEPQGRNWLLCLADLDLLEMLNAPNLTANEKNAVQRLRDSTMHMALREGSRAKLDAAGELQDPAQDMKYMHLESLAKAFRDSLYEERHAWEGFLKNLDQDIDTAKKMFMRFSGEYANFERGRDRALRLDLEEMADPETIARAKKYLNFANEKEFRGESIQHLVNEVQKHAGAASQPWVAERILGSPEERERFLAYNRRLKEPEPQLAERLDAALQRAKKISKHQRAYSELLKKIEEILNLQTALHEFWHSFIEERTLRGGQPLGRLENEVSALAASLYYSPTAAQRIAYSDMLERYYGERRAILDYFLEEVLGREIGAGSRLQKLERYLDVLQKNPEQFRPMVGKILMHPGLAPSILNNIPGSEVLISEPNNLFFRLLRWAVPGWADRNPGWLLSISGIGLIAEVAGIVSFIYSGWPAQIGQAVLSVLPGLALAPASLGLGLALAVFAGLHTLLLGREQHNRGSPMSGRELLKSWFKQTAALVPYTLIGARSAAIAHAFYDLWQVVRLRAGARQRSVPVKLKDLIGPVRFNQGALDGHWLGRTARRFAQKNFGPRFDLLNHVYISWGHAGDRETRTVERRLEGTQGMLIVLPYLFRLRVPENIPGADRLNRFLTFWLELAVSIKLFSYFYTARWNAVWESEGPSRRLSVGKDRPVAVQADWLPRLVGADGVHPAGAFGAVFALLRRIAMDVLTPVPERRFSPGHRPFHPRGVWNSA